MMEFTLYPLDNGFRGKAFIGTFREIKQLARYYNYRKWAIIREDGVVIAFTIGAPVAALKAYLAARR